VRVPRDFDPLPLEHIKRQHGLVLSKECIKANFAIYHAADFNAPGVRGNPDRCLTVKSTPYIQALGLHAGQTQVYQHKPKSDLLRYRLLINGFLLVLVSGRLHSQLSLRKKSRLN
jgi:hypothetical protein